MSSETESRPSIPASPSAIEHLARAVEEMTERTEVILTRLSVSMEKLEANQKLMLHEFVGLARRVADHEVRITELEIKTRTAALVKRRRKP